MSHRQHFSGNHGCGDPRHNSGHDSGHDRLREMLEGYGIRSGTGRGNTSGRSGFRHFAASRPSADDWGRDISAMQDQGYSYTVENGQGIFRGGPGGGLEYSIGLDPLGSAWYEDDDDGDYADYSYYGGYGGYGGFGGSGGYGGYGGYGGSGGSGGYGGFGGYGGYGGYDGLGYGGYGDYGSSSSSGSDYGYYSEEELDFPDQYGTDRQRYEESRIGGRSDQRNPYGTSGQSAGGYGGTSRRRTTSGMDGYGGMPTSRMGPQGLDSSRSQRSRQSRGGSTHGGSIRGGSRRGSSRGGSRGGSHAGSRRSGQGRNDTLLDRIDEFS